MPPDHKDQSNEGRKMRIEVAMLAVFALVSVAARAGENDALQASSREAATQLTQQLGAQLRKELAAGGAEAAIGVCKSLAPEIAGSLSRQRGIRVARVSLRVRNPLLGTPDTWEQRGLAEFDRRVAAGQKAEMLEISEIVSEPDGRYWRYLKAIPVQGACLVCHGAADAIPVPVKATLRQDYPHDRATGYAVGQVRGAVTIKQRISE
jgi:hypothetical protein